MTMTMRNVEVREDGLEWDQLVAETARVFALDGNGLRELSQSATARIIATIPFVAGCRNPERSAASHLCLYVAEKRGFEDCYGHRPSDDADVFERLAPIAHFEGGNGGVIHHGLCLLARIMLEGYRRSRSFDRARGTYNPLNSGAWNYEELRRTLTQELERHPCAALDSIAPSLLSQEPVDADW